MRMVILTAMSVSLCVGTAWAHEDAAAHTHNEVVLGVVLLVVVFAGVVIADVWRRRRRGDEQ